MFLEQQKMQLDIQKKSILSSMEIAKEEAIAQKRANVASWREMQKMVPYMQEDGKFRLEREFFGQVKGEILPFNCESFLILYCKGKEMDKALYVKFKNTFGEDRYVYFYLKKLSINYINLKFTAAGINFGFKKKIESEIRWKIVEILIDKSELCLIPERHGWYEKDGVIMYAFPEQMTWKEVVENAV